MGIKKYQGFTLLELLVVLCILLLGYSVIASISFSNNTLVLQRTARDMVSALRYARNNAIVTHQETAVVFDVNERHYKIMPIAKVYNIPDDMSISLQIAKSQLANDKQGSFRFFPDGSSSGGRVFLTRGEQEWQINIIWLTGQIELEQH